jgi:hypothetical protein
LVIAGIGLAPVLIGIFWAPALWLALLACGVTLVLAYAVASYRAGEAGHYISVDYLDGLGFIRFFLILGFLGLYIFVFLLLWFIAQIKTALDRPRVMLPWMALEFYPIMLLIGIGVAAVGHVPPQQNIAWQDDDEFLDPAMRRPRPGQPPIANRPPRANPAPVILPPVVVPAKKPPVLPPVVQKKPVVPDADDFGVPKTPVPGKPAPEPVGPLFKVVKENVPLRYLSDLPEFDVKDGPWKFTKNGMTGEKGTTPITVAGIASPKGLGMHPPFPFRDAWASAKYRLGKKGVTFKAAVAINDQRSPFGDNKVFHGGEATFEVIGDDLTLWESKPMNRMKEFQECAVDLVGVEVLELRVRAKGPHLGLHAVWLEPRVLLKKE